MQIVIEIPDSYLLKISEINKEQKIIIDKENMRIIFRLIKAVHNGISLPKGHGDLVDISPYKGKVICSRLYSGVKKLIEVDSIEPIIEADKED